VIALVLFQLALVDVLRIDRGRDKDFVQESVFSLREDIGQRQDSRVDGYSKN
jgi:hypothetical protein